MTYKHSVIKQRIEYFFILPIVLLGRIFGKIIPPKKKYSHFLFFPSGDIGGSIKVNADITNCIKHKKPLIIFSKIPKNNKFKSLFEMEGVDILDLSKWIDKKGLHFINIFFRGFLTTWINKNSSPLIFGGESLYFYKMIPHQKKKTRIIELCHLNTWFNYSQAFIKKIDTRIFSTLKIKNDAEKLYQLNNINPSLYKRLFFIDNKIEIPVYNYFEQPIFQILFVGRGAKQKRIHLIKAIALKAYELKLPVHFTLVGDVESYFNDDSKKVITIIGEVKNQLLLETIYNRSDALILTSEYEGLPLVIMDMMARGKIVISTAVDGIPDYISHKITGMLIDNLEEESIIEKGIDAIFFLINNPEIKKQISLNAYQFASSHFDKEKFNSFYQTILD